MAIQQRMAASFLDLNLQATTAALDKCAILAAILMIIPNAQAQTLTILHTFTGHGDGGAPTPA